MYIPIPRTFGRVLKRVVLPCFLITIGAYSLLPLIRVQNTAADFEKPKTDDSQPIQQPNTASEPEVPIIKSGIAEDTSEIEEKADSRVVDHEASSEKTAPPPAVELFESKTEPPPAAIESSSSTVTSASEVGRNESVSQLCHVPHMEMNDPEVAEFFKVTAKPLECHKEEKNWVRVSDDGRFIMDSAAAETHANMRCSYHPFWRLTDDTTNSSRFSLFKNNSQLMSDFFQTKCTADDGLTFRNIYATIFPENSTIIEEKMRLKQLHKSKLAGLNVHILGLDSLSRMTVMRTLKQTYAYLVNELKAVVLEGYNIVGDGTPQAFIPILTAKTELELPNVRRADPAANYVDVYPFLWNNLSAAGYMTLYGEDAAKIGTFTYRLTGFDKQPTNHYLRTFFQKFEDSEYSHHRKYCLGNEPVHKLFWDYGRHFYKNYPKDLLKFSLLHYSWLTHDDLSQPPLIDVDLQKHLLWMQQSGHLNNTLLIVMSDHGHRFARLRATHQGQLEERLPFMSFVAPDWFTKGLGRQQWLNLQQNVHRLSTPFDIHATLMELLDWNKNLQPEREHPAANQRSQSLWHPIAASRSCEKADIAPHWCSCLSWVEMDPLDSAVQAASQSILQTINDVTLKVRDLCSELQLHKVESARRLQPREEMLRHKGSLDTDGVQPDLSGNTTVAIATYQIRLRTQPGNALYEATVVHDNRDPVQTQVDLAVVSHINPFGDMPHCVIDQEYALAKWCVCYDKIDGK